MNRLAVAFLTVIMGAFGILGAAWVFMSIGRGEYLSAVVALGAVGFSLGIITMLTIVVSGKVAPRLACDQAGTMVRPDRRVDAALMASTFAMFAAMLVFVVATPLGLLDIPLPLGNGQYIVFVCGAGVVVGVFSLSQIIRQRGTSFLQLNEAGVVTGNTMTRVERSWAEIAEIRDRPPNARRATGATYIVGSDGRTREVPSDWYTPGGHDLRELVRFYWKHPDARVELTDGRSLNRFDATSGDPT